LTMYYSGSVPGFVDQAFADLEVEHHEPSIEEIFG
jgi:hypothetical protein